MSDNWIGMIKLTNEDAVYGSDGAKVLDYLLCDGSELDAEKFPILAGLLPSEPKELITATIPSYSYGVCFDGQYVWVMNSKQSPSRYQGVVYQYNADLTPTGFSFNTPELGFARGMVYDGTNIRILDTDDEFGGSSCHTYTPSGTYLGYFSISAATISVHSIALLDNRFYIATGSTTDPILYSFTLDGTYSPVDNLDMSDVSTGVSCICAYDGAMRFLDYSTGILYSRDGEGTHEELVFGNAYILFCMVYDDIAVGSSPALSTYTGVSSLPLMDTAAGATSPYKIIADGTVTSTGGIAKTDPESPPRIATDPTEDA